MQALGFLLMALPAAASFATYGATQDKMNPLLGALLAGAVYAAADLAGAKLSGGGLAGLSMERVGALALQNVGAIRLNPMARSYPALSRSQHQNLGYLVPQSVGACFGTC